MVHTLSGLQKLKFSVLRTRCEAYGRHSFWVAETYVLHSQNEVRSLWSIFILGCGNLSFPFPERRAKPMVHIHSELRKRMLYVPRTKCEAYGRAFILGCGRLGCPVPERSAKPIVDIHSKLQKLIKFSNPGTRREA
jgi:hypothetical protein